MITANDLKMIDEILMQAQCITNMFDSRVIDVIRNKITVELNKIEIKVENKKVK